MSKTFTIKLSDTTSEMDEVLIIRASSPQVSNTLKYQIKRPASEEELPPEENPITDYYWLDDLHGRHKVGRALTSTSYKQQSNTYGFTLEGNPDKIDINKLLFFNPQIPWLSYTISEYERGDDYIIFALKVDYEDTGGTFQLNYNGEYLMVAFITLKDPEVRVSTWRVEIYIPVSSDNSKTEDYLIEIDGKTYEGHYEYSGVTHIIETIDLPSKPSRSEVTVTLNNRTKSRWISWEDPVGTVQRGIVSFERTDFFNS